MNRHIHKYAYINIVIVAAIALVYFLSTSDKAQSVIAQTASSPIYRATSSKGAAALVSWYDADPAALELYAQSADSVGVKLNVFVSSEWLAENNAAIAYALANGHIAGIYGNDIPKDTAPDDVLAMLQQARAAFGNYLADVNLYMPNNGEHTKRLSNSAAKAGLSVVVWSKDSRAYVCGSPEEFAAEVVKNADDGDFILVRLDERLHQALPAIAGQMAEKGMGCASLVAMLQDS